MSRRLFRSLAGVTALTLALILPGAASASHSWGGYHWARTTASFDLKLGDNVDSRWDYYLTRSSGEWSTSSVLDTSVVPGLTKPRSCRPTTGRVEVCNAAYGNTGWLGVAGISITSGSHITKGYVKLNDYYFDSPQYNTPAWRALVMCQEIGHTFGLDHQDEGFDNTNLGTCMDYTSNPSGPPSNESPNQHDYDQLEAIYAHLDSSSTVGAMTASSSGAASSASEFGRLVSSSSDGKVQTFVRQLRGGNLEVTFVIWA